MSSFRQRRYPVYDTLQTGVQFAMSLVDTDEAGTETELDVHNVSSVPGAASIQLRLVFEDPSGVYHTRLAIPGSTVDDSDANDNDIVWINTDADRLFDKGPPGRWLVSAEAEWLNNASLVVHRVRSPSPAIFYTRQGPPAAIHA